MTFEYLTPSSQKVIDYVLLNIAGEDAYLYTTGPTTTSATKNLFYISPTGATAALGSATYSRISAVRFDSQTFRIFWNTSNSSVINYRDFNYQNFTLGPVTPLTLLGQDVFVRKFNDTYLMTYIFDQNLHLARSEDGANWEFVQTISSDARFSIKRAEFNLSRRLNGFDVQIAEIRALRTQLVQADCASSKALLGASDARAKLRFNVAAGSSSILGANLLGTNIRQDTFKDSVAGLIGGHGAPLVTNIFRPEPPPEIEESDSVAGLIGGHGAPLITDVTRPPPPIEESTSDSVEGLIGGHGAPIIITVTRS